MFEEEGKFAALKEAKDNFGAGKRLSSRKKKQTTKTSLWQNDAASRTITDRCRQPLLLFRQMNPNKLGSRLSG